jgi:hypothetical protein
MTQTGAHRSMAVPITARRDTTMKRRIRTVVGVTTLLTTCLTAPALAANDRMQLECTGGDLAGTTIERTNGSSWWAQPDDTVYTTRYIRVTDEQGDTLYEHNHGKKSGPTQSCVGNHFGSTWYVEIVAAGSH